MPFRRNQVSFAPKRGPRRATEWLGSADVTGFTALAAGAAVLDQSLTGAQVAIISPFTITRTVGMLAVTSDQVAATEQYFGAIGGAVVEERARAAGVGSLPIPIGDESSDSWFLFKHYAGEIKFASGVGIDGASVRIFEFDSRAQRKVEEGQAIIWTLENASANNSFLYLLKFRMLIKKH